VVEQLADVLDAGGRRRVAPVQEGVDEYARDLLSVRQVNERDAAT
jgi:hypothetical protein